MKGKTLVLFFVLLTGCATAKVADLSPPPLIMQPADISLPAWAMTGPDFTAAVFEKEILASDDFVAVSPPFYGNYMRCGWVPYDQRAEIKQILENASIVMRLVNVYEKWIPINGAPEKYYVLQIE